jgi:enoyl-[acyl-carrier protein] reductase II
MIETRITEMFGLKYPIIQAPMGPYFTRELCVAVSEAGGLGTISHTNLKKGNSIKNMKNDIKFVIEHTDKPFGFNIRVARMQPDAMPIIRAVAKLIESDPKVRDQCVCGITSAGSPKKATAIWQKRIPYLNHFHVAPTIELARKVADSSCIGLIATGAEGGGHQSYEQVTTLILLQHVRREFPEFPLIASGGFATPEGIAMAIGGGADAVAMGTRFIATTQCEFHPNFKSLIYPAKSKDTMLTTGVFGPVRVLKNKFSLSQGKVLTKVEKVNQEHAFSMQELDKEIKIHELVYHGDVENGAVLVGQSVGLIDSEGDVGDIISSFSHKAEEILKKSVSRIV